MSDVPDPAFLPGGLGIPDEDWPQTPVSVRLVMLTLLKRLATLEARVYQHSSNSSRLPSTDTPSTKRQRQKQATEGIAPHLGITEQGIAAGYRQWAGHHWRCPAH